MSEIYRPLERQAGQRGLEVRDMGGKKTSKKKKKGRFVDADLQREDVKKTYWVYSST